MTAILAGLLGYLQNGTVDMLASGTISATDLRRKHFGFSYPVVEKEHKYYVRRPIAGFLHTAGHVFQVFSIDFYLLTISVVCTLFLLSSYSRTLLKSSIWSMCRAFILAYFSKESTSEVGRIAELARLL